MFLSIIFLAWKAVGKQIEQKVAKGAKKTKVRVGK
jgi:hypothetical protein